MGREDPIMLTYHFWGSYQKSDYTSSPKAVGFTYNVFYAHRAPLLLVSAFGCILA
jgi:hypothetical protein